MSLIARQELQKCQKGHSVGESVGLGTRAMTWQQHQGFVDGGLRVSWSVRRKRGEPALVGEGRKIVKSKCADGKLIIDVAV